MYCVECGKECAVIEVDFGIGAYEYWGATGFHSDVAEVSKCCEAEVDEVPPNFTEPNANEINEIDVKGGEFGEEA